MARERTRVEIKVPGIPEPVPISRETHESFIRLLKEYQHVHQRNSLFLDKLRAIDRAYACYESSSDQSKADEKAAQILDDSGVHFTTPVVLSQVDSIVAFLTEIYLSGYPIFPVVSPPGNPEDQNFGEQLEAVIDDHSVKGRWPRHLNKFFRDGAKYNMCALELDWAPVGSLQVNKNNTQVADEGTPTLDVELINRMFHIDMYNLFWDQLIDIPDVIEFGDYVGYNDLWTRGRLKRFISDLNRADEVTMNIRPALESLEGSNRDEVPRRFYNEKPLISRYKLEEDTNMSPDWMQWALSEPRRKDDERINYNNKYLFTKFYSRIIPSDHGLSVPEPNIPQIWKFVVINNSQVIHMKKVISAFDMFPMFLGQFTEDGFRMQTKSVAEQQLPIQDATTELVNIRLSSARRAISDRGIYDPELLDPQDVNSRAPAAKIPMKQNLKNLKPSDAYHSIEFNDTGTARAFDDIAPMLQLSEFMGGLNSARQGNFRRGNRTLGEFQEVMSNSDMRSRMIALMMEYQVFIPLKRQIKGNILLNMTSSTSLDLINNRTDRVINVNISELRSKLMEFKLADGYLPTTLLGNTEAVSAAFNLIAQSPRLQAEYMMGPLFSHFMSLIGVRGIQKFQLPPDQVAANLEAQAAAAGGGPGDEGTGG